MIEPENVTEPTPTIELIDTTEPTGATETSFGRRLGRTPYVRIGAVVVAGLALVVSAALTMAASPAPSAGAPAASPQASGGGGGVGPSIGSPWGGMGMGRHGGFGMMGPGGFGKGERGLGGPGFGQITIAAINGSSLSLKTADGWSRTITITSSATITRGGQTISASDLKVGDEIRIRETRDSSGTFTITAIDVVLPHVDGTVSAVTGSGFTVKANDGTTTTVEVTGSTTYQLGRSTGSKSDVKVGVLVDVQGTRASDGSLTATAVRIALPTVAGQVTAKSGDSLTVTRPDGTTMTIKVGSGTTYQVPGKTSATLADITVGMRIVAQGTQNADGSLQASAIRAGSAFGGGFRGWMQAPGMPSVPGATTAPSSQG